MHQGRCRLGPHSGPGGRCWHRPGWGPSMRQFWKARRCTSGHPASAICTLEGCSSSEAGSRWLTVPPRPLARERARQPQSFLGPGDMASPGERSVGFLPQSQGTSCPLGEPSWAPPVPGPISLLLAVSPEAGMPKAKPSLSSDPHRLGRDEQQADHHQ